MQIEIEPVLQGMLLDRQRLLRQLAHLIRRVGASNPHRSQINRRRATKRRELRRAIRTNAEQIAAFLTLEMHDAIRAKTKA